MDVLVTGQRGMVGTAAVRMLYEHGGSVTGFDLADGQDVRDTTSLIVAARGVDHPRCTNSRESARNTGFPPRECRYLQVHVRTEQQHPYGRLATRSAPEWRAPSTSSPTDTACATAATEDSPKPTCNTYSRPSP